MALGECLPDTTANNHSSRFSDRRSYGLLGNLLNALRVDIDDEPVQLSGPRG
jgi:hypothetical protein